MPLSVALAPFLLAASLPAAGGAFVAFTAPAAPSAPPAETAATGVEAYDPVGRAQLIAERIPRHWKGTYRPFTSPRAVPAMLVLQRVTPLGQMVDLRGQLTLAGLSTPVQGTINAKSNQLDLLILGNSLGAMLEPGGEFQGQQGLSLSGWLPDRATGAGGRLQLNPGPPPPSAAGEAVRGLW
ncbi:MAG: hypothetical protein VKO19_05650 [Cyanobacteriota bacterium]|nr:hypothetical protein [Cyanobacteriota bacterium]